MASGLLKRRGLLILGVCVIAIAAYATRSMWTGGATTALTDDITRSFRLIRGRLDTQDAEERAYG